MRTEEGDMSAITGVSISAGGNSGVQGTPGATMDIVETTLADNARQADWYQTPLRIPDARNLFPIGVNLNLNA